MTNVLAIDLGASSGRAMLGSFSEGEIKLKEISRFNDYIIYKNEDMMWDIDKIMEEIFSSMIIAEETYGFDSIAIDTWGVDIGLINSEGELIRNPIHYRDSRTRGILDIAENYISLKELYCETGIQIMEINTLFQLLHLKLYENEIYDKTEKILLMPDLINYLLTGKMFSEKTIASTSQLFDPKKINWNKKIIDKFGFKPSLFSDVTSSGNVIGNLKTDIKEKLSISNKKIVSIASHDTASAVLSVPTQSEGFTFLSSGTWSLLGQELNNPIIDETTYKYNIANEVGSSDTITFLSNITGLWILEESIRYFKRKGKVYSYDDIQKLVNKTEEINCYIDVDDASFAEPGDMPVLIKDYAKETQQNVPNTPGELFKVIYQSLAFKYRQTEEMISSASSIKNDEIYIIGGGSKADLLSQLTADVLNKKVVAGPSEATALGNIMMQLIALDEVKSIKEARKIISSLEEVKVFNPKNSKVWENRYESFYK